MIEDKPITRRRLLAFGGSIAAVVALPGTARAAGRRAARRPARRASWLKRSTFSSRVGQKFTMTLPDGSSAQLSLRSVADLSGKTSRGRTLARRNDAFALSFKPVGRLPAGDGLAEFSHAQLGRQTFFAASSTTSCTVIVNRSE